MAKSNGPVELRSASRRVLTNASDPANRTIGKGTPRLLSRLLRKCFHLPAELLLSAVYYAAPTRVQFEKIPGDARTSRRFPPPSCLCEGNKSPVESSPRISARSEKERIPGFRPALFYHVHFYPLCG